MECKFVDAWDKEHTMHDKVPIFTEKPLDGKSEYPQDGVVACEIIRKWTDQNGRNILTVTTEKPWAVDTIDGVTVFDLVEEQLTEL